MDFSKKELMKGDDLKLLRVLGSDIFYIKPVNVLMRLLLVLETLVIFIYIYYFLNEFNLESLFQNAPVACFTIFGTVSLTHLSISCSFISKKPDGFKFWSEYSAGAMVASRIKQETYGVNIFTIINTLLVLVVALSHVVSQNPEEYLLVMNLQNVLPFGDVFGSIYMIVSFFFVYSMFYLLRKHMEFLTKDFESRNNAKLFYNHKFQKEILKRLIFCMGRYEEISGEALNLTKKIRTKIVLFSLAGCLHGIGAFMYIYQGMLSGNYVRPGVTVALFISTFWGLITASQLVESESEKLFGAILRAAWYNWDNKNKRILLTFLPHVMKPFQIKFSRDIGINYKLGLAIVKGIFSVMSVFVQIKGKENLN